MKPSALVLALALVTGCSTVGTQFRVPFGPSAGFAGPQAANKIASAIDWQPWSPDVFARAARENKLVLVDVGIEGCSACRWMHEDTYRDPEIAKQIGERFIAVSVDADAQPDLGERFEEWGWPATIFLTGNGTQVQALRGSRGPKVFASILAEVADKRSGSSAKAEATKPEPAAATDLETMCVTARARLDSLGDDTGWGGEERIAFAPPVEHAFLRSHTSGETSSRTRALAALTGEAKLLDPVWGGVYVASTSPSWDSPIVEKRTVQEAHALATFAEGYHATSDAQWLDAAKSVHRYLRDFMLAPDGTFYSTQQDDAPNLPRTMTADDYYKLSDAERRRYGIPPVDHGVYTDQNGPTIAAYVRLYEATGDREMLGIATRAADVLVRERQQPSGTVLQFQAAGAVTRDERIRAGVPDAQIYLKAQAEFGLALVAIARATGEVRWIDAANRLARGTRAALEDKNGGFFSASARSTDGMFERRKPFNENILFARFLNQLSVVTANAELREAAQKTLRAVATPSTLADQVIWGVAPYALFLEELASKPIEITVVTNGSDPRADQLFARAVRLYEPRKIVRMAKPGKYPDRGRPALYVCTATACSKPVVDPAEVERVAAPFIAEKAPGCGR